MELSNLIQLEINENLRNISIPKKGVVFGVDGDIEVNRVAFVFPRYYSNFDMTEFSARVNYVNANGEANYYEADDMSSDDGDTATFSWLMTSDVTSYIGEVRFSVLLYKRLDERYVKKFGTRPATGRVLEGLDVESYVTPEQQLTLIEKMEKKIDAYVEAKMLSVNHDIEDAKNGALDAIEEAKNDVDSFIASSKSEIDSLLSSSLDDIKNLADTSKLNISTLTDEKLASLDKETVRQLKNIELAGVEETEKIRTAFSSAVSDIQAEGQKQADAVDSHGDSKIKEINDSTATSLANINSISEKQVEAIQLEGTKQASSVSSEGNKQVSTVVSAGTTEVTKVKKASSTALSDIGSAKESSISEITAKGTEQVKTIKDTSASEISKVQAAGMSQVKSVSDEGKIQIDGVKSEGEKQVQSVSAKGTQSLQDIDTAKTAAVKSVNDQTKPIIDKVEQLKQNVNDKSDSVDETYEQMKKLHCIEISEEAPTNERTGLWVNPKSNEEINIPEIKDEEVSGIDTWSSQKINHEIDSLKEDLDYLLPNVAKFFGYKFNYLEKKEIDTEIFTDQYYDENTGEIKSYDHWNRTGYIDISDYDYICMDTVYRDNVYNTKCIVFFDENKNFITNSTYKNGGNTILIVPTRAKYIGFSGDYKHITSDFKPYVYIGKIEEIDKNNKYVLESLKKIPFKIISDEYYSNTDGIVQSYVTWNRTNRINIYGAKTIIIDCEYGYNATNFKCNAFYDKVGNFISSFEIKNGGEVEIEVPENAYYMGLSASKLVINENIIIRYTGYLNEDELYYDELHSLSGYNTPTSDCSYTNPKGYKQNFTCAIMTDIHGDIVKANDWFDFVYSRRNFIDCGINLGDVVAKKITDDYTFFNNIINLSDIPILSCVGNHDIGDPWNGTDGGSISLSEAYNRYIKPMVDKGWVTTSDIHWFKDISKYKIRLISINQYCATTDATSDVSEYMYSCYYSSSELQWFADTLFDTPSGYTVVVLAHQFPSDNDKLDYVENNFTISNKFPRTLRVQRMILDGTPIEDIINAFKTKTSITQTYISKNSNLNNSTVSKDFSNSQSNKYACMLTGHTHFPLVLRSNKYSDQIVIVCPSTSSNIYQRSTDDILPMNKNEKNFYVLAINTELQLINILKIGNTKTQDLVERKTISIKY